MSMDTRIARGVSRLAGGMVIVAAALVGDARDASSQEISPASGGGFTGRVLDPDGKPVPYAHLYDAATGASAVASHNGEFSFASSSADNRVQLSVRRIGFQPFDTIPVMTSGSRFLAISLSPLKLRLDPVTVRASATDYDEFLDRSGFYRRMSHKVDGTFISRREIEQRNATDISAVLRNVTGVRVVPRTGRGGKNSFILGRGGICALGLVVDGRRVEISVPPREDFQPRITAIVGGRPKPATETKRAKDGDATMDEFIQPHMVAGMEIYPSAASVPNQFVHHVDGCGLVVVWTRYKQ